jgi:hypothetical protein
MKFLITPISFIVSIWTHHKARHIEKHGRHLSPSEEKVARALKIQDVSKIRILTVKRITHPLSWMFDVLASFTKSVVSNPVGLTLGHTILIQKNHQDNLSLIAHELVHVRQYESFGNHRIFLTEYIYQCLRFGYPNAPLEKEADAISVKVLQLTDLV